MKNVPFILCIETATKMCSVAVTGAAGDIFCFEENANKHVSHLAAFVRECLSEAGVAMHQLEAVAISSGPGSYTSLRAGVSAAKGMCFGLDIPLIAISTLEALAQAAFSIFNDEAAVYIPCIDARRDEIYTAHYIYNLEFRNLEKISEPFSHIVTPDSFKEFFFQKEKKIILSGDGAEKTKKILANEKILNSNVMCSAKNLIALAEKKFHENNFEDIDAFTPFYLKPPNITLSKKNFF